MNIVFIYAGEILPERGGVQRVTSVLADYFEFKGLNVYYLSVAKKKETSLASSRQHFLPYSANIKKNIPFYINFLKEKDISVVINQSGIHPEISNLVHEAGKINIKIISVINNSILSGIKNFSSLYKTRAQSLNLAFLLPLANVKMLNRCLCFLYKVKYKRHYNDLYLKSDKVILLSDEFREELSYMTGKILGKTIATMPNPTSFTPSFVNLKNKKNELLFVGRVDCLYKQVDLLLVIWSKLHIDFPDWELKIVGGGGESKKLERLSKALRLKRVSFEGFQNPTSYYRSASIFCLTSLSESFGMVLIEAMQFGVVPFAFNSYPSVIDIIDHKKNGILIPPFDCDKYSEELSRLMRDKTRRDQVAIMAQEKSSLFSIEKIGTDWIRLFNNI